MTIFEITLSKARSEGDVFQKAFSEERSGFFAEIEKYREELDL